MKTYLISLPSMWEERLGSALMHRGHSIQALKRFDQAEEILENDDPVIAVVPAEDSLEENLQFCRRLRKRRSARKLQILLCVSAPLEKENWPAVQQAGVDFVLSADFTDSELDFRLNTAECILESASPTGDVSPISNGEIDFTPDTEDIPYGEFYSTLNHKFLKVNHGLVRILGYSSKEELLAVNIAQDIYSDSEERERLIATVSSQNIKLDVVWKRRDGTPIPLQLSGHILFDEVQHTICIHGIAWDISENKRNEKMLFLQRDLGMALSQVSSLAEILDLLLDTMMQVEGVDFSGIYLVEEATRTYRMAASRGLSSKGFEAMSVLPKERPQIQLCEKGKPFYFATGELTEPTVLAWWKSEGITCSGVVPIVHDGKVIATLNIASRTQSNFSHAIRLAAETIAMQMGGCIVRVQAEESLRASRSNLQTFFDAMTDAVLVVDFQGILLHFNAAATRTLEYSCEELKGKHISELHSPDLVSEAMATFERGIAGRQSHGRLQFLTKTGKVLHMEVRVGMGTWAGRQVLFGVLRDCTEQDASRKALAESEAKFRAIFENASVGIGLSDASGRLIDANEAVARMEGLTREQIIGRHFAEFTTSEDGAAQAKFQEDIFEGRIQSYELEKRYFHRDKTPFWVRCSGSIVPPPDGEKPQYLISVIENIDARKRAEDALRESESRYRLITDNVDDVVWSAHWTPPDFSQCNDLHSMIQAALEGWHFEYISPSVERMFGFTVEDCISDLPEYRKVPESFPATAQMVMEKLAAHDPTEPFRHTFETSFFAKDGSQLWCEITVTFLPVEAGQPLWLLGILRNITRRHETQEALKKSEAQVRGLFENIPDIVALLDCNSVVRYVNHGTQAVPAEKLMGESIFSFVEPPYQEVCREAFAKALSGSEAQPVEAQVITGKYWSCRVVPMIADRDNNPVMLICTDITAEKKAALAILQEQQLLRQLIDLQERERRFLSYEIHDGFAQQITGALFHVEAFKRLREEDLQQAERNLNQAMKMLSRSIDETRRLISGLRPPILDEAGIIAAVEYLICENRARSNIDVMFVHNLEAVRLAPPLESAVFRIIQESLTNAARHSQSDFIRVELNGSDDLLEIVVFDEGVGFELASVPDGRFGLRGMRERARLLGGNVEIETSPGDGCRIRVELPLIPAAEN